MFLDLSCSLYLAISPCLVYPIFFLYPRSFFSLRHQSPLRRCPLYNPRFIRVAGPQSSFVLQFKPLRYIESASIYTRILEVIVLGTPTQLQYSFVSFQVDPRPFYN